MKPELLEGLRSVLTLALFFSQYLNFPPSEPFSFNRRVAELFTVPRNGSRARKNLEPDLGKKSYALAHVGVIDLAMLRINRQAIRDGLDAFQDRL